MWFLLFDALIDTHKYDFIPGHNNDEIQRGEVGCLKS